MTPSVTGNAAQAARYYRAASGPDPTLAELLRGARVTSRSVGVSLGGFGLSYESAGITLGDRAAVQAARARREFADAFEATGLYEAMSLSSSDAPSAAQTASGTSPETIRRGLAAYARQSSGPAAHTPPMLSLAV